MLNCPASRMPNEGFDMTSSRQRKTEAALSKEANSTTMISLRRMTWPS